MTSKYSELPHLVPLPALRGRRGLMEKEYSDHSPAPHFGSLGDRDCLGIVVDEKERVSVYIIVCVFLFFCPESFYMCCLFVRNMFDLPILESVWL